MLDTEIKDRKAPAVKSKGRGHVPRWDTWFVPSASGLVAAFPSLRAHRPSGLRFPRAEGRRTQCRISLSPPQHRPLPPAFFKKRWQKCVFHHTAPGFHGYSRHVYDNCQPRVFTQVLAGAEPQPRPEQQMARLPKTRRRRGTGENLRPVVFHVLLSVQVRRDTRVTPGRRRDAGAAEAPWEYMDKIQRPISAATVTSRSNSAGDLRPSPSMPRWGWATCPRRQHTSPVSTFAHTSVALRAWTAARVKHVETEDKWRYNNLADTNDPFIYQHCISCWMYSHCSFLIPFLNRQC